MTPLEIITIIQAIISSVPSAIQLFEKIAPLLTTHAVVSDEHVDEIRKLAPVAMAAVEDAHKAMAILFNAHDLKEM